MIVLALFLQGRVFFLWFLFYFSLLWASELLLWSWILSWLWILIPGLDWRAIPYSCTWKQSKRVVRAARKSFLIGRTDCTHYGFSFFFQVFPGFPWGQSFFSSWTVLINSFLMNIPISGIWNWDIELEIETLRSNFRNWRLELLTVSVFFFYLFQILCVTVIHLFYFFFVLFHSANFEKYNICKTTNKEKTNTLTF